MKIFRGNLVGGPLTGLAIDEWQWIKSQGGYSENKDFFEVHWEFQDKSPNIIRLHVEAPTKASDPVLNRIKEVVIIDLLSSGIESVALGKGYGFEKGKLISSSNIKTNKCTEAFRIVLSADIMKAKVEDNLILVHADVGVHIDRILQKFSHVLDAIL